VNEALFAQATQALTSGTADVDDLDAAIEAARTGFARLPWAACGPDGERRLNSAGLSVRCLTAADGSVPASADADDLYAIVARAY
jgi:prolyl-tRNA synthetase